MCLVNKPNVSSKNALFINQKLVRQAINILAKSKTQRGCSCLYSKLRSPQDDGTKSCVGSSLIVCTKNNSTFAKVSWPTSSIFLNHF